MPLIRSLLIVALIAFPRIAAAEAGPASLVELGGHIEVAEQAWIEAILTPPVLVSLGAFPDWSNPDIELSSTLRERL